MARISKDPDIRRREFLDIATELFLTQGYARTTVDDIVNRAGVAKGTLYYYFRSKEDILTAVVDHLSAMSLDVVRPIAEDAGRIAPDKLRDSLLALRAHYMRHSAIMDEMHDLGDDLFHLRSLIGASMMMAPIFGRIIEAGVTAGDFRCEDPESLAEILLLSSNLLCDGDLFPGDEDRMGRRLRAIQRTAEQGLGLSPDSLAYISRLED